MAAQIRAFINQALAAPPEEVSNFARLYRTSFPLPAFKGAGAIAFGAPGAAQRMVAWVIPGPFNLEKAQAHLLKLLNTEGSTYPDTDTLNNIAALNEVLKYLDAPPVEGTNVPVFLEFNAKGIWERPRPPTQITGESAILGVRVAPAGESRPFEFTPPRASRDAPSRDRPESSRISTLYVRSNGQASPVKSGNAPVVSIKRSRASLNVPQAAANPVIPVTAEVSTAPATDPSPAGEQFQVPAPATEPLAPASVVPEQQTATVSTVLPDTPETPIPSGDMQGTAPTAEHRDEVSMATIKAAAMLEPKFVTKKVTAEKASALKKTAGPKKKASPVKPVAKTKLQATKAPLKVPGKAKPIALESSPKELDSTRFMKLAESLLGNGDKFTWSSQAEESGAEFIDVLLHFKHPGVVLLVHRTEDKGIEGAVFLVQVKGIGILRPEIFKHVQFVLNQLDAQGPAADIKAAHFTRPESAEGVKKVRSALSALYDDRGWTESFHPAAQREASESAKPGTGAKPIVRRRRAKKATSSISFVSAMPLDPEVLQFYNDAVLSQLGVKRLKVRLKNPVSIHADTLVCKGPILLSRRLGKGPDPSHKFQKKLDEPTWGAVLMSVEESLGPKVKEAYLEALHAAPGRIEFELGSKAAT